MNATATTNSVYEVPQTYGADGHRLEHVVVTDENGRRWNFKATDPDPKDEHEHVTDGECWCNESVVAVPDTRDNATKASDACDAAAEKMAELGIDATLSEIAAVVEASLRAWVGLGHPGDLPEMVEVTDADTGQVVSVPAEQLEAYRQADSDERFEWGRSR